jgi:hypothetical protein
MFYRCFSFLAFLVLGLLLDNDLFYAKVTNLNINTFYQISDLPIEYRRNKQHNKPYPTREIIRIKRMDVNRSLLNRLFY